MLHETGHKDLDVLFTEYNGLLLDRRFDPTLIERCLAFLCGGAEAGTGVPSWDELRLGGVTEGVFDIVKAAGLLPRPAVSHENVGDAGGSAES